MNTEEGRRVVVSNLFVPQICAHGNHTESKRESERKKLKNRYNRGVCRGVGSDGWIEGE